MTARQNKFTRREFLNLGLTASFAVAGLSALYTIIRYLAPPVDSAQLSEDKVLAGTLDELPPGSAKFFRYKNKPAIIINSQQGLTALSAVCTHLGCIVKWDAAKHALKCPCHEGFFDVNGRVLGGPPPRPLPAFKVAVADNKIYVGEDS